MSIHTYRWKLIAYPILFIYFFFFKGKAKISHYLQISIFCMFLYVIVFYTFKCVLLRVIWYGFQFWNHNHKYSTSEWFVLIFQWQVKADQQNLHFSHPSHDAKQHKHRIMKHDCIITWNFMTLDGWTLTRFKHEVPPAVHGFSSNSHCHYPAMLCLPSEFNSTNNSAFIFGGEEDKRLPSVGRFICGVTFLDTEDV